MHSDPTDWLRAFLGNLTAGPWTETTALLGAPPALVRMSTQTRSPQRPTAGLGDVMLQLDSPEGGLAEVWVRGPLVRGLVAQLLGEPPAAPAQASAAEAGLLAGLLQGIRTDLDLAPWDLRDAVVFPNEDPAPLPAQELALALTLGWQCGPAQGELWLGLDGPGSEQLRSAAARWLPAPGAPGSDQELAAELVLARTTLDADALATVQPGDAVLFDAPGLPEDDWPVELTVAGRRFAARLHRTPEGRALQVLDGPAHEAVHAAGQVELAASLGQVGLTAGAVASLAPGVTVSLDRPVGDPVWLLAGDGRARGTLLEVDGSLAVQLSAPLS